MAEVLRVETFPIDLVVGHLKGIGGMRQVREAADYAVIQSLAGFNPPEGFVLLTADRGGERKGAHQVVQVFFGVVLAVRNYRQEVGKPALDSLEPVRAAVKQRLNGWTPVDAQGRALAGGRPCEFRQGDVLDYDGGKLLWSDVYETQFFSGSTQQ